jgi:hypothetical protein
MEKKSMNHKKKGQEEMVGFGLILIIVAVVFIVFISIYIKKPTERSTDAEVSSFVQATLQYTTQCQEENMENLSIQKLIGKCQDKNPCFYHNLDSCLLLNNTIKDIVKESWNVKSGSAVKGYFFNINISEGVNTPEKNFLNITSGVVTNNYRTGFQPFGNPNGENIIILFNVYT